MEDSPPLARGRWSFLSEHRIYRDLAELLLAGLAFLLYFIVRANVIDRPDAALTNARSIMDVEKTLGLFFEPSLQRSVLDSELLVRVFNFVYFWLDFPLIVSIGVVMYFGGKRRWYTFTRDAILFSGAMALISYNLFPVAPPRLELDVGPRENFEPRGPRRLLARSKKHMQPEANAEERRPPSHLGAHGFCQPARHRIRGLHL